MVSMLASGLSSLDLTSGPVHWLVFLVYVLNSHSASLHQVYKWVHGYQLNAAGSPTIN